MSYTVDQAIGLWKVRSSTEIETDGNRWSYVVSPVSLQIYGSETEPVAADDSTTFATAWNVYELNNTTTQAAGVTVPVPGTDFVLKPIPDDYIVPGAYARGYEKQIVYLWFPNQFDGAC